MIEPMEEPQQLFAIHFRSLWKARNEHQWNNKQEEVSQLIERAHIVLHEWSWARNSSHDYNDIPPGSLILCTKPPVGFLKCNVDFASS